jgi:tRNA(Ile)-lysidine synthase
MLQNFAYKMHGLKKFALAVSGGADSICMTLLCHQLGLKPVILIVDHKLREESSVEALHVKNYIEEHFSFEVNILTWNKDSKITSNVQSRARDARYILLTNHCKMLDIKIICTAHNKNDQAETVLMNIMRGTGIEGLIGIREIMEFNGMKLVRPMLTFSRDEIEKHLQLYGINWINDPSNESDKYERVKIRKLINFISNSDLVNGKHLISRLNLLSNNAIRTQNFIEIYLEKKIGEICHFWDSTIMTVDLEQLIAQDEEIILRILRRSIQTIGMQKYSVRSKRLIRLYNDILKINKTFYCTLGGCYIWSDIRGDKIFIIFVKEICNAQNKILKNEVKEVQLSLYNLQPEYIVYDHDIYQKAQIMFKTIPSADKILSSIECKIIDRKKFYPLLGLARLFN